MRNKLLNELDNIDPIYIDEHLEWSKRKTNTHIMVYRAISVAACLVLIVTSVLVLIPGGFFKSDNSGVKPSDTVQNDTQHGDVNKPHADALKIIYAKDFEVKIDDTGSENIMIPTGRVEFAGSLYDIMKDTEPYIDCTFAVSVSFSMEFEESEEYLSLIAEAEGLYEAMWDRYYNEFRSHKLSVHNAEVMDWDCEDCLRYHSLHEQDEKKIDDLNREALKVSERTREEHDIKLSEYCNSLMESMGIDYRFVTINWINASDDIEPVVAQELRILHLTKEQLLSFKVTDKIGAEFVLLPEWVDCGEDIITGDYNLYPAQNE